MRGLQKLQLWKVEGRLVEHQPRPPGGEQPVACPALAGLGHDDGGAGAGEQGQQEQGEGGVEPLGGQRGSWRRRWW